MEQWLAALGGLFSNTNGAGYGQSGVGPGGMGANNGLADSQLFTANMPRLTPEQLHALQAQMAAEMLEPQQPEEEPAPQPIEQPQGQPQRNTNDALADILARYGFSDETNRQPTARAWGSLDGGTWNGGSWNG